MNKNDDKFTKLPHYNVSWVKFRTRLPKLMEMTFAFFLTLLMLVASVTCLNAITYFWFGVPAIVLSGILCGIAIMFLPTCPFVIVRIVREAMDKESKCGIPPEYRSGKWWIYLYYIVYAKYTEVTNFYVRLVTSAIIIGATSYLSMVLQFDRFHQMILIPFCTGLVLLIWLLHVMKND